MEYKSVKNEKNVFSPSLLFRQTATGSTSFLGLTS